MQVFRSTEFYRHLEGWPLAALAVAIALLGAALAVPRSVAPEEIPVPDVDRREERRARRADAEHADAAEREPLAFEVRAVGEALRRYGAAEATPGGPPPGPEQLAELRTHARAARARHGDVPLLRLRAVQSRLFCRALERWEATGSTDADLPELGGRFLEKAQQSGWIDRDRRIVLEEPERAVLFHVRWADLTGLAKEHQFRPSLNEWRIYYRALLEHPDAGPERGPARHAAQRRYVLALQRLDPEFPAALALGVIAYQLGDYAQATSAFRTHLDAHPGGAWRLRAQNHLAASQAALGEAP